MATVVLDPDLTEGYEGVRIDLINEKKVPSNVTCDYLFQVRSLVLDDTGEHIFVGTVLYFDGPEKVNGMVTSRTYVYVSADWSEEQLFTNIGDLWRYIAQIIPVCKRYDFARGAKKRFEDVCVGTLDLRGYMRRESTSS